MPDVGDIAVLTLSVTPSGEDTEATIAITPPPGAAPVVLVPTTVIDRSLWTAELPLAAAGEWRAVWTVTGTGAGVQHDTVWAIGDPPGRVYATPTDYVAWTGQEPPGGIRRLLLRASRMVDKMLRTAIYPVDVDGLPTDLRHAAAIRDATSAQAEWFAETGDTTGVLSRYQSVGIGSVSLTRGSTSSGPSTGEDQLYAPAALDALRSAGLLGGRPLVSGRVGGVPFFATEDGT